MSSSRIESQRLDRLRARYRAAFREWTAARNGLVAVGRSAGAESDAQAHEVAAALAYRNARDHLTDAMSGLGDRVGADVAIERRQLTLPAGPLHLAHDSGRREWLRDFALALGLIGIAVAGGTFLAEWVP